MRCCDPCDNGQADFTAQVTIPAGGVVILDVPPDIDNRTCRRAVTCVVINRNNQDVNVAFTPNADGEAVACNPLPNPIPANAVGPFINPGVLSVPIYSTQIVLCNPGDNDITIIVQWFSSCQCASLCDPNMQANSVVIDQDCTNPVPVEICSATFDYEFACAQGGGGVQGRIIVVRTDNQVDPPNFELFELDGTPINDGTTATNCVDNPVPVAECYQDINDSAIRFTRITLLNVTTQAVEGVVWLDANAVVIPPPGNVETCNGPDWEFQCFCDDGTNPPTPFLRRFQVTVTGVSVIDTDLTGITPYVAQGNVVNCEQNQPDNEVYIACDDNTNPPTPFVRRLTFNVDGTVAGNDFQLDGITPYVLQGNRVLCSSIADDADDHEFVCLCDDNTDPPTQFLRRYTVDSTGTVTTTDTELDGTTAYAVQGIGVVCPVEAIATDQNYQGAVYDIQNGATWTPADLPGGVELIEISLSVIVGVVDNGITNADATAVVNLPTGYSVDLRAGDPNGIITPHQVIDSGTGGRVLIDATWRLP